MKQSLRRELQEHLPYSVFCAAAGLMLTSLLLFLSLGLDPEVRVNGLKGLFHTFHASHLLLSATATSAMFYHYERKLLKAVLTGFIGATIFCGLSDVVVPALGAALLGGERVFHVCLIEHPALLLPFVIVGCFAGCGAAAGIEKSTVYSHSGHVLVSTMASIFYLVTFCGADGWFDGGRVGSVFILITIAVIVPCCLSDIVFPLLIAEADRKKHDELHPH